MGQAEGRLGRRGQVKVCRALCLAPRQGRVRVVAEAQGRGQSLDSPLTDPLARARSACEALCVCLAGVRLTTGTVYRSLPLESSSRFLFPATESGRTSDPRCPSPCSHSCFSVLRSLSLRPAARLRTLFLQKSKQSYFFRSYAVFPRWSRPLRSREQAFGLRRRSKGASMCDCRTGVRMTAMINGILWRPTAAFPLGGLLSR